MAKPEGDEAWTVGRACWDSDKDLVLMLYQPCQPQCRQSRRNVPQIRCCVADPCLREQRKNSKCYKSWRRFALDSSELSMDATKKSLISW